MANILMGDAKLCLDTGVSWDTGAWASGRFGISRSILTQRSCTVLEEHEMSRIPRALVLLVACSAILLLVASAQAQPGERRGKGPRPGKGPRQGKVTARIGGAFGAGQGLLRSEQVQKELELVEDQKAKLKAIGEEMRTQMSELYSGMRDLKPEERRAKHAELREKSKGLAEKTGKKIQEVLLPNQRERLKQIQLQVRGIGALNDKEVSESLGITEEQKGKFKSLREEMQKKRQAAFGGFRNLSPEERKKKMEEMRNLSPEERQKKSAEIREQAQKLQKEAVDQALGVLTSEQRESFEKMKGEKFELDRSKMLTRHKQGAGGKRGPGGRPGKKGPGKKGPGKDKPAKE